jgi:hypothetical protein
VGVPVPYPASFNDIRDVLESGKGASEISITPKFTPIMSSPIPLSSGFWFGGWKTKMSLWLHLVLNNQYLLDSAKKEFSSSFHYVLIL